MRISKDEWFLQIALVVSKQATCARRKVGAVIVDERGYILSTGYNGLPSGFVHCIDKPCHGAQFSSGTQLDCCQALHAEQNAIARLREPFEAVTMYVTTEPCVSCTKLALATSIQRIVFAEPYAQSGKTLWQAAGKQWQCVQTKL